MEEFSELATNQITLLERLRVNILNTYNSIMTDYHLERIKRMTLAKIIEESMTRMLFSEYLALKNFTIRDEIILSWKCYELCSKIEENPSLILEDRVFRELIHTCPSSIWEIELLWALVLIYEENENESEVQLIKILNKLKKDCIRNMENHSGYQKFITDLQFKSWRLTKLMLYVYKNKKYKNYSPQFLDIEDDPFFIV